MRGITDAYTHNVPRTYLRQFLDSSNPEVHEAAESTRERSESQPNLIDFETRISQMNKYGISKQVTCLYQGVDPNHIPVGNGTDQVKLCSVINDGMSKEMEKSGGRIFALGTPPLQGLEAGGIEEIRRAIRDLGLKGFMVVTNVHGEPVDHFKEFWDEANHLGVPVYLHPVDPVSSDSRPYEDEYDLMHVLGWPFETSLTMARLVFSGTMSRNPDLRVVAHHLGAMIPYFAGRINESYDKETLLVKPEQRFEESKGTKPSIERFRGFYLDTAIGGNRHAIECAREIFGAQKIIFGTDYPFGPSGGTRRLANYPDIVRATNLSAEEKRMILEENATKLLGI